MDRTRDYFVADIAAVIINSHRQNESDRVWTAEDLLEARYPKRKQSVIITGPQMDPDHGAAGNWRDLRAGMKALTQKVKTSRRGRR